MEYKLFLQTLSIVANSIAGVKQPLRSQLIDSNSQLGDRAHSYSSYLLPLLPASLVLRCDSVTVEFELSDSIY
jgi:hypothetical protein